MTGPLRPSELELESLRRSEQRFRSTFDSMLEGCQILGHDWRYLYLNPAAEVQSRRSPGSLIDQRFTDAWPGVESTELYARVRRCLEERLADRFENEFEFPDGSRGWFELRIEPVPEGVLILSADVTERRRGEARERRLAETLAAITRVNRLIVSEKEPSALLQGVCDTLVGAGGISSAWVALAEPDGRPGVVAHAGPAGAFDDFHGRFVAGWRPRCWDVARRHADGSGLVALDPHETCRECPLAHPAPAGWVGAAPLRHGGRDFGTLGLYRAPGQEPPDGEASLLNEVADDLALALYAIRGEQERSAFARMVESSEDGIALVDRDHRFLHVNPAYARMWGHEPAELIGRRVAEFVGEDFYAEQVRERLDDGLAGRRVEALVTRDMGDRGIRTAEVRYDPIQDRDGTVTAVAVTLRDVTERMRAESRLQESEHRLSVIFTRSPVGLVLSRRADGRIVDVNPVIAGFFGWHREELIGRSAVDLGLWADPAQREQMVRELGRRGGCRDFELTARRRDGTPRAVRLSLDEIDFAGEPHLLGVLEDITERKEAEARREQLEAQLRASQKMEAIGTLAGGVAHDFNNLLVVILNCTDFALDVATEDGPLRHDLLEVKGAAERAVALTRQLLAFGRKQVLQPEPLSLNRIVEGLAKMLRRILGEDIELVLELAPDLGIAMADPGQVEQVLMNLVTNARDAMPEGGRLVIATANVSLDPRRTRGMVAVKPGAYVELSVTDTGCGMDAATQSHVFEPFFTTKEKGRGTGLGMATTYGIVKQSEGYIWIQSALGRGTRVSIDLPRVRDTVADEARAAGPGPQRGKEAVLVVEDEAGVRDLVRRTLSGAGYEVAVAADRDEAWARCSARETPFDLLVTDVVMPRVGGRRVAEELVGRWPGLRVLYISGYTDDTIARHGIIEPGTQLLAKPFTLDGLLRRVREVLDAPPAGPPR